MKPASQIIVGMLFVLLGGLLFARPGLALRYKLPGPELDAARSSPAILSLYRLCGIVTLVIGAFILLDPLWS